MTKDQLQVNAETISKLTEDLDRLEVELLEFRIEDSVAHDLMEVGYWANELLQARLAYSEHQQLVAIVQRVSHLQMLYLQSAFDLRAQQLTQELKSLISDDAWRVFLRLDEVYEMEKEFFHGKTFHHNFNIPLLNLEQEVLARYKNLKLKTF